jgi:hypothetical protein
MPGTLITVAPTGAEADKAAVPALPVTLDELVATARECQAAGAAVIHVHIRDDQARPTLDLARLTDTVSALREATDLIVQLSTGGAVTDGADARLAVLEAAPDACSLTCGTVNFGADVFLNSWPFIRELYARTQQLGIVPEFELFDLGHVAALHRLLDDLGAPAGGAAGRRHLVGYRHRPHLGPGHAGGAQRRRAPAGGDGGHDLLRPGASRHGQRRAGRPSIDPGRTGPAPGPAPGRRPAAARRPGGSRQPLAP